MHYAMIGVNKGKIHSEEQNKNHSIKMKKFYSTNKNWSFGKTRSVKNVNNLIKAFKSRIYNNKCLMCDTIFIAKSSRTRYCKICSEILNMSKIPIYYKYDYHNVPCLLGYGRIK